ncbi:hypothetical protein [Actinacidiphila oryziradicis]|uniref:DUF3592 domain-containing protein n=1 Tax=Actinacidiphila oryziradicis TaxID=2571141 RepID=A0A4U0RZ61_9ACTN|nr:hypothetical protein [Actinacidiphila oryziradicis]TKA01702.1 hypothetical protein FCI23_40200 [Actinacidiphila oryziradicis]
MEVDSPAAASKRHPLAEGSLILARYDPDDPHELLLHGPERATLGYAMVSAGTVFILLGVGLLFG